MDLMQNLLYTHIYLKTFTVTTNCSDYCFCVPVYIDSTANISHFSTPSLRIAQLITSVRTLFCSLAILDPMTYFLHLSLSSVILIDSFTGSPVHVLMLSTQAVRGLPRLRASGIVPCIISFSRQLPCFLMV